MAAATLVREAREDDAAACAAIYRPAVEAGASSFELAAPDAAEMAGRMAAVRAAGLPWLAAERDGRVAGYAYAGRWRARPAYRFTLEDSIYVAPWAQGAGVGRALMTALLARAEALGARSMIAVIGDPGAQPASVALHRAFGFAEAGLLRAVGWKAGAWRDTLLMQRALGPGADAPPDRDGPASTLR